MHYFFLGVTVILPADLEGVTALITVLCLACAATVFTAALCLVGVVALTGLLVVAVLFIEVTALAGVEPFTGVTLAGVADFTAGAVTFTSFTDFTTGAVAANALVEPPTTLTTLLFLSI
ncbi:hypothetical protein BK146_27185 [Paenibacillus sp. FSL R7-0333]|nr:hypothetical protein BK146_27185 [Paenibacillus sp. FSL R7-0333]